MAEKKATTYTLREIYSISHSTVQRLQKNLPVSTYSLDRLCKILDCRLDEVAEYMPDEALECMHLAEGSKLELAVYFGLFYALCPGHFS